MLISARRLDAALRAAGIPIDGCASDGRIDFRAEATDEQRRAATAIRAAQPEHDPDAPPTYAELRAREYPPVEALVVALWERDVEGRPEAAAKLQEQREAIKRKYPAPVLPTKE